MDALAYREKTLLRLFDANIVGIATCDADGRILEANDAYLDIIGYSRNELASGQVGWRELTPPEWNDVSDRAWHQIQATGRCDLFEKEYFRKDGSRVPILLASAAIDDDKSQIVAFILDLTARKRAEDSLRRSEAYLAEAQRLSHTGSWAGSPTGAGPIYWSDETFRIFERPLALGSLDAVGMMELVHPSDRQAYRAAVGEAFRARSDFVVDFRIVLSGGGIKHVHKIGHPVLDNAGAVVEWVGTIVDVTERKHAEEEHDRVRRLESEREAEIARERGRLAGEIHDTLAQGLAMIVMQLADAEAKLGSAWSRADKPLTIARELAADSLAYARRSVNVLRNVGGGGLARSVRDVVDSDRRLFNGSINLVVTGAAVLHDASVEAALLGIVREALTNAVKHSAASNIAVEVEFVAAGGVRATVSDDGVGFDSSAARPDSYGLLSMQERAARAGVALTFVTEPGAGTTVIASWSPESAELSGMNRGPNNPHP
jgi:PAS domain S-box-containing protein